jgi:mRNA (2'-O-methyladenosine-N6-)-methyltransferase
LQNFDLSVLDQDYNVLVVDPPWDIHMNLPYEKIPDQEVIEGLKGIESLQGPGGLIFLWVTDRAIELGIECLE